MHAFDASSMIYAWDNYPLEKFPGLWEWMGEQIKSGEFVMLTVALDETGNKSPDCKDWIEQHEIQKITESDETYRIALMINGLLGIKNDQYGAGVGENDVLIIASAKERNHELVSNESRQNQLPKNKKKYKIPAVCSLLKVNVTCLNFLELIKQSKAVFG